MRCFSDKTTLTFLAQICPKRNLGLEIQKINVGIRISILDTVQPPRYHMCQFWVKMDNFEFFGLNVAKLSNYVQYFSSNTAEGVAESWVEVEMSWMEVDGAGWRLKWAGGGGWSWVEMSARFSNTHFFYMILLLKYST